MNLEKLHGLMFSNVHRVDGNFPFDVTYYDGGSSDVVDEGIDVYYCDDEGNAGNVWIEEIVRVDENGVIHCRDHKGHPVEVEIFERMKSFD